MHDLVTSQKEKQQKYIPDRPLLRCPICKKLGYEYIRKSRKRGISEAYMVHYNESPIGFYKDGKIKYRQCFGEGRLYATLEDLLNAYHNRKKQEKAHTKSTKVIQSIASTVGRKSRPTTKRKLRTINCPQCHHRGRLNTYQPRKYPRYLVVHEPIDGTWGKNQKVLRRRRCYMHVGSEMEKAKRRWDRK